MTRSRRAEAPHHPQPHPNTRHPQASANAKAQNNQAFAANLQRNKRQLDTSARDFDQIITKKARIAVEIPARSSFHSRNATDAKRPPHPQQPPTRPATIAAPNGSVTSRPPAAPPITIAKVAPPNEIAQQPAQRSGLTKHKEKVVNGLKHELDRLQPNSADTKDQGRKLRSQEATRFKSELSAYFPDYDEVIGNDPKEQHLLNVDTPIIVVQDATPSSATDSQNRNSQARLPDAYPIRSYGDSLFMDLWDSQRIDFSFLTTQAKTKSAEDPLPDSLYEPAHKKSERLERSIRNSEKGRAQHEKDQIIRLLDGLQGPDWLRVMGVSGITESRKKTFEPAREHFIKGCQTILEKFRTWAAEEKRRKLEKDRAEAQAKREAERLEALEEDGNVQEEEDARVEEIPDSDDEMEADSRPSERDADPPDESDVEASVAKQLREEALAAAKTKSRRRKRTHTPQPPPPPHSPELKPQKEFTSFFDKKYKRDAALNKGRRRGRSALAWGQPVPELAEKDFELPSDFIDDDTLKARERSKRRNKRGKTRGG
ncbi:hypothetical protein OQA88_1608 [Cercophora sp. LCS_1]